VITDAEYLLMVRRCLENGVPVSVVARIFELDPELVAEARRDLLVAEYGTAEQSEYRASLEWKTLATCHQILESGSPAEKARIATQVLGRQIAKATGGESDASKEARDKLEQAMASMRSGPVVVAPPGRFVLGPAREDV
jgi:transposase-like protein